MESGPQPNQAMKKPTTSASGNAPSTTPPTTQPGALIPASSAFVQLARIFAAMITPESAKRVMKILEPAAVQLSPDPAPKLPLIIPEDLLQDLCIGQIDKQWITWRLVFWLKHKDNCHSRPQHKEAFPGGCDISWCRDTTELVAHGRFCTAGDQCGVDHCPLSKRILSHCETCTLDRCSVCEPLNKPSKRRNNINEPTESALTGTAADGATTAARTRVAPACYAFSDEGVKVMAAVTKAVCQAFGGLVPAAVQAAISRETPRGSDKSDRSTSDQAVRNESRNPGEALGDELNADRDGLSYSERQKNKETEIRASNELFRSSQLDNSLLWPQLSTPLSWHTMMAVSDFAAAISLRGDTMRKLVDVLCPHNDPSVASDPRMTTLISYVRKVEAKIYQRSNSEEEYCRLMAAKTATAATELEEKRKRILEICQLGTPNQPTLQNEQLARVMMDPESADSGNRERDMIAAWTEASRANHSDWHLERQTGANLRVNRNRNYGSCSDTDVCIPIDSDKMGCSEKTCPYARQLQVAEDKAWSAIFVCVVVSLFVICVGPALINLMRNYL